MTDVGYGRAAVFIGWWRDLNARLQANGDKEVSFGPARDAFEAGYSPEGAATLYKRLHDESSYTRATSAYAANGCVE